MPEEPAADISQQLTLPTSTVSGSIDLLAGWAVRHRLPFACYRLPEDEHFNFVSGSGLRQLKPDTDLSELPPGFLIGEYEGKEYFLPQALSYSSASGRLCRHEAGDELPAFEPAGAPAGWQPYTLPNPAASTTPEEHHHYVQTCLEAIHSSELIKVVPSRVKRVALPGGLTLSGLFERLCRAYPHAFVSLVSAPETGTWLGATPESLIEVDENGVFTTMSLAGTQAYDGRQPLHTLPWTQKEIEEQAMVSRYIINRFKEIRLREFVETGPRTVQAGNMAHLCTTFRVDTRATGFHNLGPVMLRLLHPTSAVCGMPKEPARALIKSFEKHTRRLYSGYLGPLNTENGSHIFVNLRCMEVLNGEALLYAGGGVTAYSDPAAEWQETELKCNTLLNLIKD